jgi:lupus La protein
MSNLKAEATEPDPAATSLPNDEVVNKESGDQSAPTDKEAVMANIESENIKGGSEAKEEQAIGNSEAAEDVKEEKVDVKTEGSGATDEKKERIGEDGVLKTSAQIDYNRKNHSKYDPSVLPTTDDPSKIRAQVCSSSALLLHPATNDICKGRILLQ